jgi:hypothetical protein
MRAVGPNSGMARYTSKSLHSSGRVFKITE